MKKFLKIVGIIILVFIVVGIVGGGKSGTKSDTNTQAKTTEAPKEAQKVTVRELADAFEENQVAAEANWEGKLVEFSAPISNITDFGISFTNVASKQFSLAQIMCKTKDKQQLLSIKKDQTVAVRGVVGKQTLGVIEISDCEIVK